MVKAASKKNVLAARQAEAQRRAAENAVGATGGEDENNAPQGNVMQFNVDQLFAALGAKDFELTMLRADNQRLQQVVKTYQNLVRNLEATSTPPESEASA